jgi:hypothetical protein
MWCGGLVSGWGLEGRVFESGRWQLVFGWPWWALRWWVGALAVVVKFFSGQPKIFGQSKFFRAAQNFRAATFPRAGQKK